MASLNIVEFTDTRLWGIAWWTPLAYGLVTGGSFLLFVITDRLIRIQVDYVPNRLAYEYLLISGFYLAIFFFRQYPYILSLSLLLVVLVRLIFFHYPLDILYFIFGACVGPTVELVLTNLHLYFFAEPDFLGMPYWLPIFWGNVALAMRRVSWILEPPKKPEKLYEVPLRGM
jgi:hypothetical protein